MKKILTLLFVTLVCFYSIAYSAEEASSKTTPDSNWSKAESAWKVFSQNYLQEQLEKDSVTPYYKKSEEFRNKKREFIRVDNMPLLARYFPDIRFYAYDSPWEISYLFALTKNGEIFNLGSSFGPDIVKDFSNFIVKQGVKISDENEAIDIVEIYFYLFDFGPKRKGWVDFVDKERLKGKSVFLYYATLKDENLWKVIRVWQCGKDDFSCTMGSLDFEWYIQVNKNGIIEKMSYEYGFSHPPKEQFKQ